MALFHNQILRMNLEKLLSRQFNEIAETNSKIGSLIEARYDASTGLITEIKNPCKKSSDGCITFEMKKNGNGYKINGFYFGEEHIDENVRAVISETVSFYNNRENLK